MIIVKTWVACGAGVVALALLAGSASAGAVTMRHSGTVVEVGETTIVLAEVGPWQVADGQTVLTYRTIEVASDTPLLLVRREQVSASGYVGDFVESTVLPWGVVRGDFVTVDCLHKGKRQIAREIVVFEPTGP